MPKTAVLARGEGIAQLLATGSSAPAASQQPSSVLLDGALALVKDDLQQVTVRVLDQLKDPVARKVVYLVTAGGKRLRPALVLLAGHGGKGHAREALLNTAAAIELIHTATLIHDDIIDQSPLRRAQPSFHHRWGTERAVLMGDYLYATAFSLLSRLESPYVMRVISDVCQQLCRGELSEVEARFKADLTEEEYTRIIADKTASLIGACCESGAYLSGASHETVAQLKAFGIHFGLAFQIIDDCLDLTGDQSELGKEVLSDLDKGLLSLPLIYLAQRLTLSERNRLFACLKQGKAGRSGVKRMAQAAMSRGAVAQAQAKAMAYAQQAREALDQVSSNGLFEPCRKLVEYAVIRKS